MKSRLPKSQAAKLVRKKSTVPSENELIEAFDSWIHNEHPNPERQGCLGTTHLSAVAGGRQNLDERLLDHICQCAPCFDELTRLRFKCTLRTRK
jgi:hypothetical protein